MHKLLERERIIDTDTDAPVFMRFDETRTLEHFDMRVRGRKFDAEGRCKFRERHRPARTETCDHTSAVATPKRVEHE